MGKKKKKRGEREILGDLILEDLHMQTVQISLPFPIRLSRNLKNKANKTNKANKARSKQIDM